MMIGSFGVFDGVDLLQEFGDDVAAEEYRAEVLELGTPEPFRRSAYDDLQIYEIPAGYDPLHRVLVALRASRNRDLAIARCLATLRRAQKQRAEARRAAA
jgi:hypothetical protein